MILLMNHCQKKSFRKVEINLKALCAREWNPLNYNLILNKDILLAKPSAIDLMNCAANGLMNCANDKLNDNSFKCANSPKIDLKINTSEEYARQYIGKIFQYEVDYYKITLKVEKQKDKVSLLKDSIDKGSQLTSSILYKHRQVLLSAEIL